MEGQEEAGDGGFAAAGGADEGGAGAGVEGEVEGGEDRVAGPGGVGEGGVGEGDGSGVRKPDVARAFVRAPVGEEREAEETGRGGPAGVHLGDEGYDVVGLGYAEEEHGEDRQDGLGGVCARGDEDGAVVEDQGGHEQDAGLRESEEEAGGGGALESYFEGRGDGLGVLFAEVAFEGEGSYGADVAECFGGDRVGSRGCVIASVFPVAGDGFEGASDDVHERRGCKAYQGESPA